MPKFKNFKDRKGKLDQARNNRFVKLAREIYVEARNGGANPEGNFKLKTAIANARQINMPNENIERALKKAAGDAGGENYEEIIYEGYGPGGVAIMVECLTDNRNRTAAEVRAVFNKNGGNMGESGCVSYMFDQKGILIADREQSDKNEDTAMMLALEAGAGDLAVHEDTYEFITDPREFESVKNALEQSGFSFSSAEVRWVPQTMSEVDKDNSEKLLKMFDAFDDNDDVQDIYTNFEMDEDV